MSYEPRDGDISLFNNDKKGNPKTPDMRGTALVDGVKFKVSMWTKSGAKGEFLSGRIELDDYKPGERRVTAEPTAKPKVDWNPRNDANAEALPPMDDEPDSLPF